MKIISKSTFTRPNAQINYFKVTPEFFTYRKEKYVDTGILTISTEKPSDTVLIVTYTFTSLDEFYKFRNDDVVIENRFAKNEYNKINGINEHWDVSQFDDDTIV